MNGYGWGYDISHLGWSGPGILLSLRASLYVRRTFARWSKAGVAAHEAGHAIQHHAGYLPMQLRQRLIIPARIGSQLSYFIILAGILLNLTGLAWLGVGLFGAVLAFEVVTIPVELNASSRAGQLLTEGGLINLPESQGVRAVLTAAAFTYIAAMLTTLLTLLYFITQLRRRND